jgi:transcription elongation GreA/GreB family factor
MNIKEVKQWLASGGTSALESAWMDAIVEEAPADHMREVLDLVADAKKTDLAESLAEVFLSERMDQQPPHDALASAIAVLPAVRGNDTLRKLVADLYTQVHAEHPHFDELMQAAGLTDNQTLRRAIQTLEACLPLEEGTYIANRYEPDVRKVQGFNDAFGEFELVSPSGQSSTLDPKLLGDEFDVVEETDYRVLTTFRREELPEILKKEPASILLGVCQARGGSITADRLKELLTEGPLERKKWSSWWGRARTAARKSPYLTIEGRNPTVIEYHPRGRSLEEELASDVEAAKTPLAYYQVLLDYEREARHRGVEHDEDFVRKIMDALATQAGEFRDTRQDEALAASLAIITLTGRGLPGPSEDYPSASEELAGMKDPATAVARVGEPTLWPAAYEALDQREDAPECYEKLLRLMPAGELDTIASRLIDADRADAIGEVASDATLRPVEHVEVLLWLWKGPSVEVPEAPSRLDILSRFFTVMRELSRDAQVDNDFRRDTNQKIRSALTDANAKRFREVIQDIDEGLARTIKRRVERADGLSDASREQLLGILREEFYTLFMKEKVDPWLDESVTWITEKSMLAIEAELKELNEVTIPANSRAIGAAAELGDLSENGEWQYAIEERRRLQGKVAQLQDEMVRARVLSPEDVPIDNVGIGSTVTLTPSDGGEPVELTILGPPEADVDNRVYSYRTPLAQAMLGHAPGDTVTLKLGGNEATYRIETIGSALAR